MAEFPSLFACRRVSDREAESIHARLYIPEQTFRPGRTMGICVEEKIYSDF